MSKSIFKLKALVSSDDIQAVLPTVKSFVGKKGKVVLRNDTIEVNAEIEGDTAKDLNRQLLSGMRRVEKKTRLRAEWTSGNTVEKFFDYVSKSKK